MKTTRCGKNKWTTERHNFQGSTLHTLAWRHLKKNGHRNECPSPWVSSTGSLHLHLMLSLIFCNESCHFIAEHYARLGGRGSWLSESFSFQWIVEQRDHRPSQGRRSRSFSRVVWSPLLSAGPGPRGQRLLLHLGLWQWPLLHAQLPWGGIARRLRELPHHHFTVHLASLHHSLLVCNDRRIPQSGT